MGDFASDEECVEYKFNGTYLKLEVLSQDYFTPNITQLYPKVNSLNKGIRPPLITQNAPTSKALNKSLRKSLEAIADDYMVINKEDPKNIEELEKMSAYKKKQLENKKQTRKVEYVQKFVSSYKYDMVRSELAPKIYRIIHDKLEKEMVCDENGKLDSGRVISELFTYFKKQLEKATDKFMSSDNYLLHEDLIESYFEERGRTKKFATDLTSESGPDKLLKLASEYDLLNMQTMAERRFKDLYMANQDDPTACFQFCLFNLRQSNFVRAEEALERTLLAQPGHIEHLTLKACFLVRRGRVEQGRQIVEGLLEGMRFSTLHNTFMAFLYKYFFDRHNLGRKYFAVSQRVRMRQLGLLGPKKEKPDKTLEVVPELPAKENDELWLELAAFFSNHCFVDLTLMVMEEIKEQEAYKVNSIMSTVEFCRNDIDKSNDYLNKMLQTNLKPADVYQRKATNAFFREYYYEAEEMIYNSLKCDQKGSDFATMLRLGFIYLRRKSYQDARNIFSKVCSVNQKSALSWLGLGISSFRLRQYVEAESALRMANIIDPTQAEVWGYTILLDLTDERKIPHAVKSLNHLLNLEMENLALLYEVSLTYLDRRDPLAA